MVLDSDRQHVAAARFDESGRGRLRVQLLEDLRDDRVAGRLRGLPGTPRRSAAASSKSLQVSCPSTISQKAAEAALLGPREPIEEMLTAYRERRDLGWQLVREQGIPAFRTQGTFYMLVDVSSAGLPPLDFARRALAEWGVAVAPGEVFGPAGDGLVRISLAPEPAELEAGIGRLAAAVRTLGA